MTKPVPTRNQSDSANNKSRNEQLVSILEVLEATLDLLDTDDFWMEDPRLGATWQAVAYGMSPNVAIAIDSTSPRRTGQGLEKEHVDACVTCLDESQ